MHVLTGEEMNETPNGRNFHEYDVSHEQSRDDGGIGLAASSANVRLDTLSAVSTRVESSRLYLIQRVVIRPQCQDDADSGASHERHCPAYALPDARKFRVGSDAVNDLAKQRNK
jgi:hypothetical protein